jgi:putative transcriptional regulator
LSGNLKSNEIKFFIGYSGWTAGQLDKEMEKESWFVTHCKMEYIFTKDTKNLWKRVLKEMGDEFALIANFPDDPSLN